MNDIVITLSTFSETSQKPIELLKRSGLKYWINPSGKRMSAEEVLKLHPTARALVAGVEPYKKDVLSAFPNLKCISRCGAGVDAIDLNAAKELKIAILNTPHEPIQAVAELTLGFFLSLMRRLPELSERTHNKEWKRITGNLLSEKKVGLIGYGKIARKVRKLLTPFEVQVKAYDPFVSLEEMKGEGVIKSDLQELLSWSEIISIHASKTTSEFNLNSDQIKNVTKGAWIVNMARGEMVDDAAIVESITNGHLSGYAADVFPEEPYYGPLLGMKNVILTPHEATLTEETRTSMECRAVQNAIDFLKENE